MKPGLILAVAGAFAAGACGVPRTAPDTEGVSVSAGPCGRGLVVVESDYQSSNVSLLDFDGGVLSPSLISSIAQSGGFSAGLGRDVVPSSNVMTGASVVLIDRTPVGVLRFVDLATARISSELPVGGGFGADPHDYLLVSEHKAYVSRYDSNAHPGSLAWDQGGDVLIVDPTEPVISGRIDLSSAMAGEPAQFTPNPGRLIQAGNRVFVLLESYANDFMSATTSRLVELDPSTDSIASTLLLDGLRGCTALALSPNRMQIAVACNGGGDLQSAAPNIDASGLALIDISAVPHLAQHFAAATFGANPIGFTLDYATPSVLFFGTLGHLDNGAVAALDSLIRLETTGGHFDELLRSQSQPFTLGDVHCVASCRACFAADAERSGGSVLRFAIDTNAAFSSPVAIRAETSIGLPPRYLGTF